MFGKGNDDLIAQFCTVTGASTKDAKKFIDKYKRVDVAVDAFFENPHAFGTSPPQQPSSAPSTSKLNTLFGKYKDPDSEFIAVDGTIKFCEDLDVDPEDVVLLAVAFELKSTKMGEWNKQGWTEGWKNLGCDNVSAMQSVLPRLRSKLGTDSAYFRQVYLHTFDFARAEGQRSLASETAQALWALLLPLGLSGGALSHIKGGDGEDVDMEPEEGWKPDYNDWWLEFLIEKKMKGISKDTWHMFFDFVRSINSTFTNYNMEEAWPSTIDDFVEYARKRLA